MKHLSHRTIAIIVALLSTLSLALAVISLSLIHISEPTRPY